MVHYLYNFNNSLVNRRLRQSGDCLIAGCSRQEPVGSSYTASQRDTDPGARLNTFALRYGTYASGVLSLRQSGTNILLSVVFALIERKTTDNWIEKYHAAAGKSVESERKLKDALVAITSLLDRSGHTRHQPVGCHPRPSADRRRD